MDKSINIPGRWAGLLLLAVTLILIAIIASRWTRSTHAGTPTPPAQQLPNGDTTDTIYTRCEQWAQNGWSQHHVAVMIGTYIAGNRFTAAQQDAVDEVCAQGFKSGEG